MKKSKGLTLPGHEKSKGEVGAFHILAEDLTPDAHECLVKIYAKAYKRLDKKASNKVNDSDLPGSNGREEPLVMGFDQRDAVIENPAKSKAIIKKWAEVNNACDKAKAPKRQHFKLLKKG